MMPTVPDVINENSKLKQQNTKLAEQNVMLASSLKEARTIIEGVQDEIERLSTPPNEFGVFEQVIDEGRATVILRGERYLVSYDAKKHTPLPGNQVTLNDNRSITGVHDGEPTGSAMEFRRMLDDGRLVCCSEQGESIVVQDGLVDEVVLRPGDMLLVSGKNHFAFEKLPKDEDALDLLLETVPDMDYSQIGGLDKQIGELRDAIELPFLCPELYALYNTRPSKGVLLYGPPGGGKTMLAKAVANSVAKSTKSKAGYFINIKGPEILNKWVGETERKIREIFQAARDKAEEGVPVVIFFDEIESLFRQRGSGVSSDVESTTVPQILAEIDGVEEGMANIIVIGATNRPDLIDPALLRPGRLDVKIKIDRPDAVGAKRIMMLYMPGDELILNNSVESLSTDAVEKIFSESPENEFLEVTYAKGDVEKLYFKDFISGSMIENIVNRAKVAAIKAERAGQPRGMSWKHMMGAIKEEFEQNEDLPNTTNPDDWSRLTGKKGERIVNVRVLANRQVDNAAQAVVDVSSTGQYL